MMDKITKNYMLDFLKSQEIAEKNESKQFELFSSYCVVEQHYEEHYDLTDIITAEGGDCGIDAIAIIVNGVMITTKEEIEDLIKVNRGFSGISVIFVQAKTSSSFDCSDIGSFGAGVRDFFSDQPKMVRNESIKEKNNIFEFILQNARYLKKKPICYLYYVTTGKWVGDQNCNARIDCIKQDLMDLNYFDNVNFLPIDADKLQKFYRKTIDTNEVEIVFENKVILPEIPNVKQSYLGYVDYEEYLKLITCDNGEIRRSVFYENVRDFQGDNAVNRDIASTAKGDARKFVLFNNGVTVICSKLTNIGNKFNLTDYQVVNGCQTSHVLFNNKSFITQDLQVPIKIIETDNEDTVNQIIKATNRQTSVPDEQLIALKEFNRKLEAFYDTYSGGQKLYYERRSKQYNHCKDVEKTRIVPISIQIKSIASMFYDKPQLASRYYGNLLRTIDVFNDEHKPIVYYTSAYTLYKLEYLFRNKTLQSKYRKFKYHFLMMIRCSFSKEIPPMNSKNIENLCEKILKCVNNIEDFTRELNRFVSIIDKYVDNTDSGESTKTSKLVDDLKSEFKRDAQ